MEGREEEEEKRREFVISNRMSYSVSEDDDESDGSLFSIDIEREDRIYVGIGKCESSMDALAWALKLAIDRPHSTVVYLVHVFPVIRFVPSPLGGMLSRSRTKAKLVESYFAKQSDKRNNLLQTYIDSCSAMAPQVRIRTVLEESDMVAKAILELIPKLNIKKLILGSTKSTLHKSKRGTASQILRKAPQNCEISIICKGKRINRGLSPSPCGSSSLSPSPCGSSNNSSSTQQDEDQEPSPEMSRSQSDSSVVKPVPVNVSNVFNGVIYKPPRRLIRQPISLFYDNVLK